MNYTIKTGANSPSLVVELYDNFGTPEQATVQGLEAAISIVFVFKHSEKVEGDAPDLRNAGQWFEDPDALVTNGVQYDWGATDTADIGAGDINFEVDVEWVAGQVETFPSSGYFELTIENDLD